MSAPELVAPGALTVAAALPDRRSSWSGTARPPAGRIDAGMKLAPVLEWLLRRRPALSTAGERITDERLAGAVARAATRPCARRSMRRRRGWLHREKWGGW